MTKIKYRLGKIVILICIVMLVFAYPTGAIKEKEKYKENQKDFVTDEIIVKLTPTGDISNIISKYDIKSVEKILNRKSDKSSKIDSFKKHGMDRLYVLKLKSDNIDIKNFVEKLNKDSDIQYAEPNYIVHTELIPKDHYFKNLWNLHNTGQTGGTIDADIDAPQAWDIQTGNYNVTIAVIDTGVDYNHEDLATNIWTNPGEIPNNSIDDDDNGFIDDVRGWDFTTIWGALPDNDPIDELGHGTHCAGIIAAVGNNNRGIVGVNWKAKIMPIKFLDEGGRGTTDDAISSILYASLMNADIMSNSWGGGYYSQALEDAIATAHDSGILLVFAAGNSYNDNDLGGVVVYNLSNLIYVAATDHNDKKSEWSNYGVKTVHIAAPGVNILSTVPITTSDPYCEFCDPTGYLSLSGTSMATPHVAGVAGLIKAQFPEFTADHIKDLLLSRADPVPSLDGKVITGARLNANNVFETDTIPPSPIIDLVASVSKFNSVTLTWTATGDDGKSGTANSYDIRYSLSPITNENWDTINKAIGEYRPQSSGSIESFTVSELEYGKKYYFGIRIFDNVGNPSSLSNIVSKTTITPKILFKDDMENGTDGWTHKGIYVCCKPWPLDPWQLGTPAFQYGNWNITPYSGSNIWATNLTGTYTGAYLSELVTPSINLSEYTGIDSAILTFRHHFLTEIYYDGGIVQISIDDGKNWTQITPVDGYPLTLYFYNVMGTIPAYSGYSGDGWHQAIFDISNYINNNVKIRFLFGTDDDFDDYPGWYIDDIIVLSEPKTIHVRNIDMSTQVTNKGTNAISIISIVGRDNKPVKGATVSGHWSGLTSDTDTGSTDRYGKITFQSDIIKNPIGNFTFTVDNVNITGMTYNQEENLETSDTIRV